MTALKGKASKLCILRNSDKFTKIMDVLNRGKLSCTRKTRVMLCRDFESENPIRFNREMMQTDNLTSRKTYKLQDESGAGVCIDYRT